MPSSSHRTWTFDFSPRLLLGFGFTLLGVVLLLGQLDLVNARAVLRYWPVLLIAIGVAQFFNAPAAPSGDRTYPRNAIVWMAVGGILLMNSVGVLRISIWDLFWPLLLIALGVRLMTRHVGRDFRKDPDAAGTVTSGDIGPLFAVLSGVKRVGAPQPFHGAEVTTFMGGAHLDLRQAILRPGDEAILDIFAVMGGCELLIPPQWEVSAPIVAIMGGIDDKRLTARPTVIEEATASMGAPRLVIRGFVMMGGVTIRS